MQLSPEQQKALEEQKAQCIFCQIIDGKMPSKQVFSDDKLVGLLDINPASKGHVLFMPKEHYPIMPLIPPDDFKLMWRQTAKVDQCIKDAMLCNQTTIFVANGGAAGQQSAHFMLHIIPREGGDGLPFDVEGKPPSDDEKKEAVEKVGGILKAMLTKNLAALGYTKPAGGGGAPGAAPQASGAPTGEAGGAGAAAFAGKVSREQVMQLINANPQIKQIILEKPEQFKQVVPTHPQLKQLFEGHDLDEIIASVRKQAEPKSGKKLSLEDIGGGKDE